MVTKNSPTENPDAKMRIMRAVIRLEITQGHLKWKIADIAKISKISRPLIYYHFGNKKIDILLRCFETIADEFYGFSEERILLIKREGITASLKKTHSLYKNFPEYGVFYQKWRNKKSPLQDKYIQLEVRYQKKLQSIFPHFSKIKINTLHGIFHGIVTAPFMDENSIQEAIAWLKLNDEMTLAAKAKK